MNRTFKYTCPDGSIISGEAFKDPEFGPMIWLQGDGHIGTDRLEEFIEALRTIQGAPLIDAAPRLAEIADRVQAATNGTWGTYYDGAVYHLGTNLRLPEELSGRQIGKIPDGDDKTQAFHDAMFIGRAPGDVRFLLAEIQRLQGEVAELAAENEILERALGLNDAAA